MDMIPLNPERKAHLEALRRTRPAAEFLADLRGKHDLPR
jgi:hypothetical protein